MPCKKNIIAISLFLIIVFLGYFIWENTNKKDYSILKDASDKNNAEIIAWNNYYDDEYNFTIMYPTNLDITKIYQKKMITSMDSMEFYIINGGVSFSKESLGIYGVLIFDNPTYRSLDDWVANEDKKLRSVHTVIEKKLLIDNNKAIMTYTADNREPFEEYKNSKKIVFFNNDKLFVIYTNGDEHNKFLNSFKFIK